MKCSLVAKQLSQRTGSHMLGLVLDNIERGIPGALEHVYFLTYRNFIFPTDELIFFRVVAMAPKRSAIYCSAYCQMLKHLEDDQTDRVIIDVEVFSPKQKATNVGPP